MESTDEELDALQQFFKSIGFAKTKASLYASTMLFVHSIRNVSKLQELFLAGTLSLVFETMSINDTDKGSIMNQLQKMDRFQTTQEL